MINDDSVVEVAVQRAWGQAHGEKVIVRCLHLRCELRREMGLQNGKERDDMHYLPAGMCFDSGAGGQWRNYSDRKYLSQRRAICEE